MCRYAMKKYKVHFACFNCRKSFKRAPIEDLAIQHGDWTDYKTVFWSPSSNKAKKFRRENTERVKTLIEKYESRVEKCPECASPMADLGLDFKAPKKTKVEEWAVIKGLFRTGKAFYACGCDGIGYIPKNEKEYREYLLQNRECYQKHLGRRDKALSEKEQAHYLTRFTQLIKMIDKELKALDFGNPAP